MAYVPKSIPVHNKKVASFAEKKRKQFQFVMIDFHTRETIIKSVGPAAYVVFETLWSHLNQTNGECFPSHETLAEGSGMSERAVRTHLAALKEAGFIDWRQMPGKRAKNFSNRYWFMLPNNKQPEEAAVDIERMVVKKTHKEVDEPIEEKMPTINPLKIATERKAEQEAKKAEQNTVQPSQPKQEAKDNKDIIKSLFKELESLGADINLDKMKTDIDNCADPEWFTMKKKELEDRVQILKQPVDSINFRSSKTRR